MEQCGNAKNNLNTAALAAGISIPAATFLSDSVYETYRDYHKLVGVHALYKHLGGIGKLFDNRWCKLFNGIWSFAFSLGGLFSGDPNIEYILNWVGATPVALHSLYMSAEWIAIWTAERGLFYTQEDKNRAMSELDRDSQAYAWVRDLPSKRQIQ